MKTPFVSTFPSSPVITQSSDTDYATGRKGELRLRFAMQNAQTALVESYFRTPLQVMRPIRDAASCLGVYLLSPAGGVVQGDDYQVNLIAEANTHALLTTQAATKVYRMPARGASQVVNIELHQDAVFEYLPDATILFKDADFRQRVNVTLHPGAVLMFQEIIMPGRLAQGEVLQFRRYANKLTVRDSAGLIVYDNACYEPAPDDLSRLGLFDGLPCWGNWYIVGDLDRLHINPDEFCRAYPLPWTDDVRGSLSPLHRNGLSARILSTSIAPIYEMFTQLWQAVRTQHLGLPAGTLRK
ncbi:MAG: hypothetical protein CL610_18795 [Anaerolineaceae bacterium]|nr:hypothetical protein [Anaerolineaceae bacterium]